MFMNLFRHVLRTRFVLPSLPVIECSEIKMLYVCVCTRNLKYYSNLTSPVGPSSMPCLGVVFAHDTLVNHFHSF